MNKLDLVLKDIVQGKPVAIVDATNREDECDLVWSAEHVTEHSLAFGINHAKGLMCISCAGSVVERLGIPPMPTNNLDKFQTPFMCPVDAVNGTTTGMSVSDRMKTLAVFLNVNSKPNELHYPGHMQVLKARDGLMKERQGHTEASVELMKFLGLQPIAIIQEVMGPAGNMMREKELQDFLSIYNIRSITTQEIYEMVYGDTNQ
jgi:3,4-dihydroxy 2-butanone 4-phosphate synthase/GTP cyclohydrolase II